MSRSKPEAASASALAPKGTAGLARVGVGLLEQSHFCIIIVLILGCRAKVCVRRPKWEDLEYV